MGPFAWRSRFPEALRGKTKVKIDKWNRQEPRLSSLLVLARIERAEGAVVLEMVVRRAVRRALLRPSSRR